MIQISIPDVIRNVAVMDDGVRPGAQIGGERQVAVVDLERHVIVGEGAAQLLVGVDRVAQIGEESVLLHRAEEEREAIGGGRPRQTFT